VQARWRRGARCVGGAGKQGGAGPPAWGLGGPWAGGSRPEPPGGAGPEVARRRPRAVAISVCWAPRGRASSKVKNTTVWWGYGARGWGRLCIPHPPGEVAAEARVCRGQQAADEDPGDCGWLERKPLRIRAHRKSRRRARRAGQWSSGLGLLPGYVE